VAEERVYTDREAYLALRMRRVRDRERPLWPYSKRATSLRLEECGNRLSRSCISILPSSIGHMYSYTRTRTATVPPSQTPGWRRAISLFPYTSATRTHRELMTPPRIILVPRISSARYCHRERLMFRRNLSSLSLSFSLSLVRMYIHIVTHMRAYSLRFSTLVSPSIVPESEWTRRRRSRAR